jgi:hypothetical protein
VLDKSSELQALIHAEGSQLLSFTSPNPPSFPSAYLSHSTMAELSNDTSTTPRKLWSHPNPETTEMYKFKSHIAHKYNLTFSDETDAENSLWRWSVDHIPEFWSEIWDRTGIKASRRFENV